MVCPNFEKILHCRHQLVFLFALQNVTPANLKSLVYWRTPLVCLLSTAPVGKCGKQKYAETQSGVSLKSKSIQKLARFRK